MVMARMRSGFAVIGDTQHLPGYSVLLCADPAIDHLTDLDWGPRVEFRSAPHHAELERVMRRAYDT